MTGIYARQSIFKKDSLSIDAQIELCKQQAQGDFIVYKDAGFSGKNTNRPEFKRMMSDVKSGKINRIVCYRIDRISRSIADFGKIWDELNAHSVEFVSVSEQFDTATPIGRAMLYIIMVFAQLERETTAQRVTDNYYKRIHAGAWPGGPAPFGYDRARRVVNGKIQTVLEPNNDIQYVIKMFESYATGTTSLGVIATEMRHEFERIGRADERVWTNTPIKRILNNPVYACADADLYAYYNTLGAQIDDPMAEYDGTHSALLIGYRYADSRQRRDITQQHLILSSTEGVVSSEIFVRTQKYLSKNQQIKNSAGSRHSWLSGLLKCAACGYSIRIHYDPKGNRTYYYCANRYGGARTCDARHSEHPEDVENYVTAALNTRIAAIAAEGESAVNPERSSELNQLKLQMIDIQNKQRNMADAIAAGGAATARLLAAEIERLDTEASALSRQIDMLNSKRPEWIPNGFMDVSTLDFEEKRVIARRLIDHIRVLNSEIDIIWK